MGTRLGGSASQVSETARLLDAQGPILDDVLVREISRAHRFARTGARIKQRVLELLPNVTVTTEPVGGFLWPGPEAMASIPFRYDASVRDRRSLDEIVMAELIDLVRDDSALTASDDPALALACDIGLARLANSARLRLEEAIAAFGISR